METTQKSHGLRKFGIILAVLLVAAYLAGAFYFSKITYPNTVVNGQQRGNIPWAEAGRKRPADTKYTFTGPAGEKAVVSAEDIKMKYAVENGPAVPVMAWRWPVDVFRKHELVYTYSEEYDTERLDYLLREGGFRDKGEKPVEAHLEVTDEGATIVPGKPATFVDFAALRTKVADTLGTETMEVDVSDLYAQPSITADNADLVAEKEALNQYMNAEVDFAFGEETYQFGPKQIFPLLTKAEDGTYSIDDTKMRDWVADMARATDTYGTERTFESTGAGTVTVPPGIYGWRMDVDETMAQMKKLLEEGGTHEAEPVYINKGIARGKTNDIGETYIEIDLSRQHLWAYKDGELLMDSPVKTGLVNDYNETPRGVHMIWSRETDRFLNGQYKDGTPYNSHVDYWMPINYGGVGLHDASWVSEFGGTQYIYNGSNGCINLPPETAKAIFDNYRNGTPVVIYESATNYSPADQTF